VFSSANVSSIALKPEDNGLEKIDNLDERLQQYFQDKFIIQPSITRLLVSFQDNKTRPVYRWYKYKEAFSASLVEYLFQKYEIKGKILDPFAGSGTALFAASEAGSDADGIELLPIGQQIINAKKILDSDFTLEDVQRLKIWVEAQTWKQFNGKILLPELRITKGAYSQVTKTEIEQYLEACQQENNKVKTVLVLALLCVLESISYTRKDGQYLRWDYRSGRSQGKKSFNKGVILEFCDAVTSKISQIIGDLAPLKQESVERFTTQNSQGQIHLHQGSCLEILSSLPSAAYNAIITSPPYCNRYDYTRTYALELALLGISEKELIKLRQEMLSCTVENRPKDLLAINPAWKTAIAIADSQSLLQAILQFLDNQKAQGVLNNNGIPRMVRGYFYEMACVIQECFRILKPGARLFMVNDNVRYAGASISVDMILSTFAEQLGFVVENILVLPRGKGNSSQQMGSHGRDPLRKCIYVWKKQ
jgi:DNA modification methylase